MDYCDGESYKQSKLFNEDPCALQIQLYYDEVDVCNEIGSRCTVHKIGECTWTFKLAVKYNFVVSNTCKLYFLGVIYYTLGNLHPKYRSALKGIHLLNVTFYNLIVKYSIDKIMEPIVMDVKTLEEVSWR